MIEVYATSGDVRLLRSIGVGGLCTAEQPPVAPISSREVPQRTSFEVGRTRPEHCLTL